MYVMEVCPAHGHVYELVHPLAPYAVVLDQGVIEDLLQGGVQPC